MDGGGLLASALDWWVEAGVDTIVEDEPFDWLAPPAPVAAPATPSTRAEPMPAERPADLAAVQAALADPAQLAALGPFRLAPQGDAAAGLMILVDMPEQGDAAAGSLLAGAAGALFDRMLAAIRLDRTSVYLASLAPARVPGGRIDAGTLNQLIELGRLHVQHARPRALLLMGDRPVQALLGAGNVAAARGRLHSLNHDGGTVAAIATYHPRFLLQHGSCKAQAWADLRMLIGEYRR